MNNRVFLFCKFLSFWVDVSICTESHYEIDFDSYLEMDPDEHPDLAALPHLPYPLIVLSEKKQVVCATDAAHRLLCASSSAPCLSIGSCLDVLPLAIIPHTEWSCLNDLIDGAVQYRFGKRHHQTLLGVDITKFRPAMTRAHSSKEKQLCKVSSSVAVNVFIPSEGLTDALFAKMTVTPWTVHSIRYVLLRFPKSSHHSAQRRCHVV